MAAAHDQDRVAGSRVQRKSGWTGWLTFTSILIGAVGVFQIVNGLTAIFRSGTYVVGEDRLAVEVDYTVWGWVHVILGLVAVAAAFGLLVGRSWARAIGILMAVASLLTNVAFIAAYPVGSTVVIALDVLIIYAIAVHGGEVRDVGY